MKKFSVISISLIFVVPIFFFGCDKTQNSSEQTSYGGETEPASNTGDIPGIPFAWPFKNLENFQPRGGSTRGSEVTLADDPSERWKDLQNLEQNKHKKDRLAILSMAGSYRVSFQFTETMGFAKNYEPPKPYFSWATEYITVLKNKTDFIRLQHILVMYFKNDDGSVKGPKVMKHWRQDWRYEDRTLLTYRGNQTWQRKRLKPEDVSGRWTQTVYQVDDGPRYEAIGKWTHRNRFSSWSSSSFKRPLPRREYSVREDYDLLEGEHTITITPNGWVHEQTNSKVRLVDEHQTSDLEERYIAREFGVNRYERITEPELKTPSTEYLSKTGRFWNIVREAWTSSLSSHDSFRIRKTVDGKKLHRHLFKRARKIQKEETFNPEETESFVNRIIEKYIEPVKLQ